MLPTFLPRHLTDAQGKPIPQPDPPPSATFAQPGDAETPTLRALRVKTLIQHCFQHFDTIAPFHYRKRALLGVPQLMTAVYSLVGAEQLVVTEKMEPYQPHELGSVDRITMLFGEAVKQASALVPPYVHPVLMQITKVVGERLAQMREQMVKELSPEEAATVVEAPGMAWVAKEEPGTPEASADPSATSESAPGA